MVNKSNCTECSKENSAYKCPKCKAHYCSVACCKLHKANQHPPVAYTIGDRPYDLQLQQNIDNYASKYTGSVQTKETVKDISTGNSSSTSDKSRYLSAEQKLLLSKSDEIAQLLKSKRLRDQIKIIEGGKMEDILASNQPGNGTSEVQCGTAIVASGRARQKSLKRMREKDSEFDAFVEKMLDVIGYRN